MENKWPKRLIGTVVLSVIVAASLPPQAGAQTGGINHQSGHDSAPNRTRQFGGPDGLAGDLDWDVRFAMMERIKLAFAENGISIPFPQQDVHMHPVEAKAA